MNTKSTRVLLVVCALFAFTAAKAQFSAGLNLAFPTGSWSNGYSTGFGLDGRYEASIQKQLNWTASLGYTSFSGKTISGFTLTSIHVIPLTGGIKYYFQESNKGFYGAADIGLYFYSASFGGATSSTTRFGFAPGIGYRLEKLDFSFRYNSAGDLSYAGLRAAYIFPGK